LNIDNATTRVNSIVAITDNWVEQDPQAVATWMQTLPEGEERDAAVARYVNSQSAYDPQAAYQLASSIDNDSRRFNQVRNSLLDWNSQDPAAAQAALANAPLTDAQRTQISTAMKNNQRSASGQTVMMNQMMQGMRTNEQIIQNGDGTTTITIGPNPFQ
jgi:hypothetical protein